MMAIAEAPAKPWRIETMAREAAMSRTVFAVRFKKIIGKTPLDFLTSLRLQYALTLLHAPGTASLDAIAKEVGYADESALRRAYQRVSGQPLRRRDKPEAAAALTTTDPAQKNQREKYLTFAL